MTSVDLLWACRELARRLELVGMDVVEVIPTAVGSADVTALVADRVIREALTGIALRRRGPNECLRCRNSLPSDPEPLGVWIPPGTPPREVAQ